MANHAINARKTLIQVAPSGLFRTAEGAGGGWGYFVVVRGDPGEPSLPICTGISPGYGMPTTLTGESLCVVELSPSWPFALPPQHFAEPEVKSAQL